MCDQLPQIRAPHDRLARARRLVSGVSHGRRIGVVGSMNVDYTIAVPHLPAPGETVRGGEVQVLPGGKSSNQAACAALLGADVSMFGLVGNDEKGRFLIGRLGHAGVDVSGVVRANRPTGTTLITVDSAGENAIAYSPGANDCLDEAFVHGVAEKIVACDVVGLCLESPSSAVAAAARLCHEAGSTVLLNYSPCPASPDHDLLRNTDVLLVNEHELAQLTGLLEGCGWKRARTALDALGVGDVVVTRGGRGSVALTAAGAFEVAPYEVDAVDTTGCGDAFMGAMLAGLASGYALSDSAELASFVSAYAACGRGAQASYGSAAQIERTVSSFN